MSGRCGHKQCAYVWKVLRHPTLVVYSRPRMAGHDTSVPAVAPFKTRRIEDQVSPLVDSALDRRKTTTSSVVVVGSVWWDPLMVCAQHC